MLALLWIKQRNKINKIWEKKEFCKSQVFGGSDPMNELCSRNSLKNIVESKGDVNFFQKSTF